MKTLRDFSTRPLLEQKMLTEDSWCDACGEADLGMRDPTEFDENGAIVIEGFCRRCGGPIRGHVIDRSTETPTAHDEPIA